VLRTCCVVDLICFDYLVMLQGTKKGDKNDGL